MFLKIKYALYGFFLIAATALVTKYLVDLGLVPFYDLLEKPTVTPKNNYFVYIWNAIYILLFMGFYTALLSKQNREQFLDFNILFILQLFLQILWTFSFFYLQQINTSAIVIIILDMVAALVMHTLFFINIWSFILFIPYFLWLLFATFLNIYIAFLN